MTNGRVKTTNLRENHFFKITKIKKVKMTKTLGNDNNGQIARNKLKQIRFVFLSEGKSILVNNRISNKTQKTSDAYCLNS